MKEKKLFIGLYNDYYGSLLTGKLSSVVSMYYDEDMSLAEIAKELSITPQAVKDSLDRAEKKLLLYESKLNLVSSRKSLEKGLKELLDITKDGLVREKLEHLLNLL